MGRAQKCLIRKGFTTGDTNYESRNLGVVASVPPEEAKYYIESTPQSISKFYHAFCLDHGVLVKPIALQASGLG